MTSAAIRDAAQKLFRAENLSAVAVGLQSKRGAATLERLVHAFE